MNSRRSSNIRMRANRRRLILETLEGRRLLATLFVNADAMAGRSGQDWQSAFHDLEAGLQRARELNGDSDAMNDIDQIWVAAGTYRPSRLWSATNPRSASFQMVDGVSLFGGFAGSESSVDERPRRLSGELTNDTVLSGDLLGNDDPNIAFTSEQGGRIDDNTITVVWIDGDSPVVLDGFTVTGGWAGITTGGSFGTDIDLQDLAAHISSGGGVLATGSGDVEIRNSVITRNHATFYGAGVRSVSAGLKLTHTVLVDNTTLENAASAGAAVYAGGDLEMASSEVRDNVAELGGGIYVIGEGRIESTAFFNNVGERGGAIYSESSLSVANSLFDANTALRGGGIYGAGSVSVDRTVFTRNFAGHSTQVVQGDGGAIWANALDVTYSEFTDNVAEDHGGGIFVVQSLNASFCEFLRNQSDHGGAIGGEYPNELNHVSLTNSIVQQNHAASVGGGIEARSVTVRDSIVSDNVSSGSGGGLAAFETIQVTGSTLASNHAGFAGGAIHVFYLGFVSVQGSRISNNRANNGAGISGHHVFVEDSEIDGNHAASPPGSLYAGSGGGIHGEASVIVMGTTIRNNTADEEGGGITSRRIELIESQIIGNLSLGNGGGISRIQDSSISARFVIVDSTIHGNWAQGDGGGIDGSFVELDQSIVTSNQSGGEGGGIAAREVVLRDSTVRSNSAVEDGGGIYASVSLRAERSSITKNDSQASGGGVSTPNAEFRWSKIFENSAELNGGGLRSGESSVFDSEFVDNWAGRSGGGLFGGTVSIDRSVFQRNVAGGGSGGGVDGDVISVSESKFIENVASTSGGAIDGSSSNQVTVVATLVEKNQSGSDGGGIHAGFVSLIDSEVLENTAGGDGGGIDGYAEIINSRIESNFAGGNGGGVAGGINANKARISGNRGTNFGGGVYGGSSILISSQVLGNSLASPPQPEEPVSDRRPPRDALHDYPRNSRGEVQSREAEGIIYQPGDDFYALGSLELTDSTIGELNYHFDEIPTDSVTAIISPLVIRYGSDATFDGSQSVEATTYRWDLNLDGEFDDGFSPIVFKRWDELEALGFKIGTNFISLQVTGDGLDGTEVTSNTTAKVVVYSTEPELEPLPLQYEVLARQVAYDTWDKNENDSEPLLVGVGGYAVDKVFEGGGFYAIGLVIPEADAPVGEAVGTDPILVFRGTDHLLWDTFANFHAEGVGYSQFKQHQSNVEQWLAQQHDAGQTVDFVGHSLGGALAQWFAAEWVSADPSHNIGRVFTYNSPGISRSHAERFVPERSEGVEHHIVNGDIVSMAGEAFVEGAAYIYSYSTLNPVDKHVLPVQVDKVINPSPVTDKGGAATKEVRKKPIDIGEPNGIATDELNSFWFHYTDPNYIALLAAAQLLFLANDVSSDSNLGSLSFQPAYGFFRGTTEATRKNIGRTLQLYLGQSASDELSPKFVLDRIEVPFWKGWSLQQVGVERTESGAIKAGGILETPLADVEVNLSFSDFGVSGFEVFVEPSRPVPIFASGFFLTKFGGGLSNFERDAEDPLTLLGAAEFTFGPGIRIELPDWVEDRIGTVDGEAALATIEGELKIDVDALRTLELTADVEFLHAMLNEDFELAFGRADGEIKIDRDASTIEGTLSSEFLASLSRGLIEIDLEFKDRGKVNLFGNHQVAIPYNFPLPFLAGTPLLNAQVQLFATTSAVNKPNESFRVAGNVGPFDFGFEIFFDGSYKTWSGIRPVDPTGSTAARSFSAFSSADDRTLVALEAGESIQDRQITIRFPDGQLVTEDQFTAHPEIEVLSDFSSDRFRVLSIERNASDVANWTFGFAGVQLPVTTSLYVDDQSPQIEITTVDTLTDGTVQIGYVASDVESDVTISLFLDSDQQGFDGYPIVTGIGANDSPYHWTPSNVPSGEYFVYAITEDDINVPVRIYTNQTVAIETFATLEIRDTSGHDRDNAIRFSRRFADEQESETHAFLLQNTGTRATTLNDLEISGDRDDFVVTIDGATAWTLRDRVLMPGETLELLVQAFPDSVGPREVSLRIDGDFEGDSVELSAFVTVVDYETSIMAESVVARHTLSNADFLAASRNLQGNIRLASISNSFESRGTVTWEQDVVAFTPTPSFVGNAYYFFTLINDSGDVERGVVLLNVVRREFAWQNPIRRYDVNADGKVTAGDALLIINRMGREENANGNAIDLPMDGPGELEHYFDVSGDNRLSARDALLIINELARLDIQASEPEHIESFPRIETPQDRSVSPTYSDDRSTTLATLVHSRVGLAKADASVCSYDSPAPRKPYLWVPNSDNEADDCIPKVDAALCEQLTWIEQLEP